MGKKQAFTCKLCCFVIYFYYGYLCKKGDYYMKGIYIKKFTALIICVLLSFSFAGCSILDFDVRNMMEAPRSDSDMAAVTEILDAAGRADYCYVQNGDYREAVMFASLTGKSNKDAFAFTYDESKRIQISFWPQ